MPEVILPCPACGSHSTGVTNAGPSFWVCCHTCLGSGPIADSTYAAIEAWENLPRALTWTHEPPKVAGWYWCRECNSGVTLCVEVYGASSSLLFGSKRDDFNPQRPVTVDGIEWAGPIAPPVE